ncbi:uncharacterized protein LOC129723675 isoform X2 [Wyeomyia smithii]|uniref:uncharacterized protein LOC129723675 isoform X2 n=1 Tax=Wyeomyia smithii TaxID=174621 RepID=UPI00246803CD|nr:uncharacterized protein LOC129723675 isoform X2 [Wyeomyia smithii]
MELQNQIYLLIAIFGGISALLLVLIVILAIYVISIRKLVTAQESEKKYENYGFEHEAVARNITDDLRSMKSEGIQRPPYKSNLAKPRNDSTGIPMNDRRKDKKQSAGNRGNNDRKRQQSESGDTSGRDVDSAFDNEINNMFDIDYYDDDDHDSVVSVDRNPRYNQKPRHQAPPPPMSTAGLANGGNRSRNLNQNHSGNNTSRHHSGNRQQHGNRPAGRNEHLGSAYHPGDAHEGKTYFNERGMHY